MTKMPTPIYNFAFNDFLANERAYGFTETGPEPKHSRPICRAHQQGQCPNGDRCIDRHPSTRSNFNNLICKHYLRGLCKKGAGCEFLHEYNLRMMPECTTFTRLQTCPNGNECNYLHIPAEKKRPACQYYEQGFCPFGAECKDRHVKRKRLCKFYMAGFCPNGKGCDEGVHIAWRAKEDIDRERGKPVKAPETSTTAAGVAVQLQTQQDPYQSMSNGQNFDSSARPQTSPQPNAPEPSQYQQNGTGTYPDAFHQPPQQQQYHHHQQQQQQQQQQHNQPQQFYDAQQQQQMYAQAFQHDQPSQAATTHQSPQQQQSPRQQNQNDRPPSPHLSVSVTGSGSGNGNGNGNFSPRSPLRPQSPYTHTQQRTAQQGAGGGRGGGGGGGGGRRRGGGGRK